MLDRLNDAPPIQRGLLFGGQRGFASGRPHDIVGGGITAPGTRQTVRVVVAAHVVPLVVQTSDGCDANW
jgi:hypothetical protein